MTDLIEHPSFAVPSGSSDTTSAIDRILRDGVPEMSARLVPTSTLKPFHAFMWRQFLTGQIDSSALPQPNWDSGRRDIFTEKYSRLLDDGSKEDLAQALRRITLGNLGFVHSSPLETHIDEAVELFDAFYNFKALPAGGHLRATGTGLSHSRNCWAIGWPDDKLSTHFSFVASRLFEGGGVGANFSGDLMTITTPVVGRVNLTVTCSFDHADIVAVLGAGAHQSIGVPIEAFVVPDTREGWVEAWMRLIDLAQTPGTHDITIDVSQLRKHGAPLKKFGGHASGPAAFVVAAIAIADVLNRAPLGQNLPGLSAMELEHHFSVAVTAGGKRRSARMSLMRWDDPEIFEFIACKTGNQQAGWTTNISVEVNQAFFDAYAVGDPHAVAVFDAATLAMYESGEPGFYNTALSSIGEREENRLCNPCGEVTLEAGGESCNIGSVNLGYFGSDLNGAARAYELMARFLYRATCDEHHDERAAAVERLNRRLGVGFFGFAPWIIANGVRYEEFPCSHLEDVMTEFRLIARWAADEIADDLRLPRPIKVTAIAPTGTISKIAGETSAAQAPFALWYILRERISHTPENLETALAAGYKVEPCIYAPNTLVRASLREDPLVRRVDPGMVTCQEEVSFRTAMAVQAALQRSFCGGLDGNSISMTMNFNASTEADLAEMRQAIAAHLHEVKGMTAFPQIARDQTPLEALTFEQFTAMRGAGWLTFADSVEAVCTTGNCSD